MWKSRWKSGKLPPNFYWIIPYYKMLLCCGGVSFPQVGVERWKTVVMKISGVFGFWWRGKVRSFPQSVEKCRLNEHGNVV